MIFNDTSNLKGIIQECERLCHLGVAGISGDTNLLKEFTFRCNEAMRVVWVWIFSAESGWWYDDSNQTDLPQATTALISGTAKYAMPTDALTIKRIEIKDTNADWYCLDPITEEELRNKAIDEFWETDGPPQFYRLIGPTIELFPAPDYSQDASLKVYFDRDIVEFDSTDTTKEPGFASLFHRAVPIGASLDWCKINSSNQDAIKTLFADWQSFEVNVKKFYNRRFKNKEPKVLTRFKQNFK